MCRYFAMLILAALAACSAPAEPATAGIEATLCRPGSRRFVAPVTIPPRLAPARVRGARGHETGLPEPFFPESAALRGPSHWPKREMLSYTRSLGLSMTVIQAGAVPALIV